MQCLLTERNKIIKNYHRDIKFDPFETPLYIYIYKGVSIYIYKGVCIDNVKVHTKLCY